MDRLRCAHCGDVIGVYEPLRVILNDGRVIEGSRLSRSAELDSEGVLALRERCYRLKADGLGPRQEP